MQRKTKIVAVSSVETATTVQLNSIVSLIFGDSFCTKNVARAAVVKHILNSSGYQQQLLLLPTEHTLYSFDGQSLFVCLFQELDEEKHEIVLTPAQKHCYSDTHLEISFLDKKKVLFQAELCAANRTCVLELPWSALTKAQMLSVAVDRCPDIKIEKVLNSMNPANLMAGAIKTSAQYRNQFKNPRLFDTCVTFGFSIDNPLLCDWSAMDVPEVKRNVSMIKELFIVKRVVLHRRRESHDNTTTEEKRTSVGGNEQNATNESTEKDQDKDDNLKRNDEHHHTTNDAEDAPPPTNSDTAQVHLQTQQRDELEIVNSAEEDQNQPLGGRTIVDSESDYTDNILDIHTNSNTNYPEDVRTDKALKDMEAMLEDIYCNW